MHPQAIEFLQEVTVNQGGKYNTTERILALTASSLLDFADQLNDLEASQAYTQELLLTHLKILKEKAKEVT